MTDRACGSVSVEDRATLMKGLFSTFRNPNRSRAQSGMGNVPRRRARHAHAGVDAAPSAG